MKLKYWIIIILTAVAIMSSYFYYLSSPLKPVGECSSPALLSRIKSFPKPQNGVCPSGYFYDALDCIGTPVWCEPNKSDSTLTTENLTAVNYPVDQLLVTLSDSVTTSTALSIAKFAKGKLNSCYKTIFCELTVPSKTPQELDKIINQIKANPIFKKANIIKNYYPNSN